jgi:SAM-dependent methyltransferase
VNLIDLVQRNDKILEKDDNVAVGSKRWQGQDWRTITLKASDTAQIRISDIYHIDKLKSHPQEIGWYAVARGKGYVDVSLVNDDVVASTRIALGRSPVPIRIPWPADPSDVRAETQLHLHFTREARFYDGILPGKQDFRILVHRRLKRKQITSLAIGKGIEIGPGAAPQIFNSKKIDVSYVEEMPKEKWQALYDSKGKRDLQKTDWSRYIIGTASDIPCDNESLDFIFSSHVFEHLANPLGHLQKWHEKLKPGGRILAVVPDLDGTKDRRARPCTYQSLLEEYDEGIWTPQRRHFEAYNQLRSNDLDVDKLMAKNFSIHVHFYNPGSMKHILGKAVEQFGFSKYEIISADNHKDFYFVLEK